MLCKHQVAGSIPVSSTKLETIMSESDWSVTYKNGIAEMRKTFRGPSVLKERSHDDYGQILIIVTKDRTRISMNGPCNMTDEEFYVMGCTITAVKKNLAVMTITAAKEKFGGLR